MSANYVSALFLASVVASGSAFAVTEAPTMDKPMKIDGMETVCTGGSAEARAERQWRAFPTRLEFVGKGGEYLGDETVNISGNGKNLSVHCAGPWVLMKLPKGDYMLSSDVVGMGHKVTTILAPGHIILRFIGAGSTAEKSS